MAFIFAANWKMNKGPQETRAFFDHFKKFWPTTRMVPDRRFLFFPAAPCLEAVAQSVEGSSFFWGSQNCHFENKGAFTGEISPAVIKEMGASYVLVGHSERRTLFNETNELLAKKAKAAQDIGLIPLFCIGETLAEREANQTDQVLHEQLIKGLSLVNVDHPVVVAYEPVWAIGTGKVATEDQVKQAHASVRGLLTKMGFGAQTPILYGGSVNATNSASLLKISNVSGFLVGGASLDPLTFDQICSTGL